MKKHTLKTALLLASMAAIMLGVAAFPPAAKAQMTKVWEADTLDPNSNQSAVPLKFSYDGKKVICIDDYITILDVKDGKKLFSVSAQNDADISYDGRWLAVMHPYKGKDQWNQPEYYNYVAIYDIESDFKLVDSLPLKATPKGGPPYPYAVRFSPDGKKLYTTSFVYQGITLTVFDIATKEKLYSQDYVLGDGKRLEVTSDGKYYVVSIREGYKYGAPSPPRYARVYDAATNKELYKIDIGSEELDEIGRISKDNKLYTRTINSIRVYDLNDKGELISECSIGYPASVCLTKEQNYMIHFSPTYKVIDGISIEFELPSCKEINKFSLPARLEDSFNGLFLADIPSKVIEDGSTHWYIPMIALFQYNGDIVENKGYSINIPETVKEDILKIKINLNKPEYLKISLLDSSGKDIDIIKEGYFEGENDIEYNIKGLSQGIYFVQINDISYKFMVVR